MAALVEGPFEAEVERITFRGEGGEPVDAIHARPGGMPKLGLVLHPDVLGIRPLFDDLARRLATHGFAVCAPEPFNHVLGHEDLDAAARMERGKRARRRHPARQPRGRGRLARRPRRRERGRDPGVLHGRDVRAQGRRHRAVLPGDRVLRDDPGARGLAGPGPGRAARARDRRVPDARDLRRRGRLDAARRRRCAPHALGDRSECEIVVYEGADHGFVHDETRPAHRAADAADAWSRVLRFLGLAPDPTDAGASDSALL